jgi:hypothetical protein
MKRPIAIADLCFWDAISIILPFTFITTIVFLMRRKQEPEAMDAWHLTMQGLTRFVQLTGMSFLALYIFLVSPIYDGSFLVVSNVALAISALVRHKNRNRLRHSSSTESSTEYNIWRYFILVCNVYILASIVLQRRYGYIVLIGYVALVIIFEVALTNSIIIK